MKIVCIAASFVPSNAANSIQVIKVCQAFVQLGHEVTLLVPGNIQIPWEEIKQHYGVEATFDIRWVAENLIFRRYDFALKAVLIAQKLKPDLIYTWVLQAAVLSLWQKVPTIIEMHDLVKGRVGPWLFRQFWKSKTPKRVLAITQALKDILVRDFQSLAQDEHILIGPDGVDLERYQKHISPEEARSQLKIQNKFTAGYTGHFYEGRGIELMFQIAQAMPDVHFLWVGGNPQDVNIWRERIKFAELKNVTLTGFVDNSQISTYQFASDILLMPYSASISVSGGGNTAEIASPMKMFEYMAAGRAIISSDLPVIHEVLDEETAIFCPPGNTQAWISAIKYLRDALEFRIKIGQNAREKVVGYSWKARGVNALKGINLQRNSS
jgi:glycosyltransferase involved in cell wall biosynthesis